MGYTKTKVAREGAITIVTLADPATMNATGMDLAAELHEAFRAAVVGEAAARATVLTGEGRGFCSGATFSLD